MITFTQGDEIDLNMTCRAHDLTGAVMTTIFKGKDGKDYVIPDDQHEPADDQTVSAGEFTLSLTEADTKAIADGENLELITKVVQSGSIIHFHGTNILTVKKGTFRK